jgi:hypothetical protein
MSAELREEHLYKCALFPAFSIHQLSQRSKNLIHKRAQYSKDSSHAKKMHFSNLGSIVLAAASAISFVKASPFFELDTRSFGGLLARDLSGSKCAPFQYGAKYTPYGEVCVSIAEGFLTVKYPDMPNGGNYSDLHVSVQTSAVTEDNQGKWPYTKGNGFCTVTDLTTASCKIPVLDSWRSCGAKLYIGVHASFSLDGTSGNTGWMEGTCISTRQNCPRYFTFTTECKCPVVTEYEPLTASVSPA